MNASACFTNLNTSGIETTKAVHNTFAREYVVPLNLRTFSTCSDCDHARDHYNSCVESPWEWRGCVLHFERIKKGISPSMVGMVGECVSSTHHLLFFYSLQAVGGVIGAP